MAKRPVAYIDADILLHRAVSFCDDEFEGEPMGDWKQALWYFDSLLEKWLKEAGKLEDYFLVLSVGKNFRKDIFPDYKGNRSDIVPHPSLFDLKDEIKERMGVIWEPNLEADDLIGIRCSEDKEKTLAISADKDFATVPCRLMVPTSHGRKKPDWYDFSEEEADRNWLIQSMMGDTIDNYTGIPGYGPKKAAEVIDEPHTLERVVEKFKRGPKKGQDKPPKFVKGQPCSRWEAMCSHASSKGMTADEMLTQVRLARILRDGDYDFDTKEITLWTP